MEKASNQVTTTEKAVGKKPKKRRAPKVGVELRPGGKKRKKQFEVVRDPAKAAQMVKAFPDHSLRVKDGTLHCCACMKPIGFERRQYVEQHTKSSKKHLEALKALKAAEESKAFLANMHKTWLAQEKEKARNQHIVGETLDDERQAERAQASFFL